MSKVFVLFTRKYPKVDGYVYLPGYEVHSSRPDAKGPKDRIAELDVGDCIDTFRCNLSADETYVDCELVTISNIDGKAKETLTETFILARGA